MTTVLLVIHLLIAIALVTVVLMQRSEGGALGIGGGGGGGGFLSGRGTANLLTRTTAALALAFFCTSILLAVSSGRKGETGSVFDRVPAAQTGGTNESAPAGAPPRTGPGGLAPLPTLPSGN